MSHQNEIKSFGVRQLGLFGSFARDSSINEHSDVDFIVEFEKDKKTFNNFIALSFYLESLLGRRVGPYLGPAILKGVENVIQ